MSIVEPPDEDDVFASLVDGLNKHEDVTDEDAFATKTMPELIKERTRIQMELRDLGETIRPKTERGHELHSKSFAIQFQIQERGEGRG